MNLISQLISNFLMGRFQNHPMMQQFNQMMQGKNPQEQMQTILNMAKSKGFDINAKIFTEEQARQLGLKQRP